jgi:hypothetical protein
VDNLAIVVEYAGFWEPSYHEPAPNNLVIFHMRKKGDAASLLFSEGKFVLTFGRPSQIPMPQTAGPGSPMSVTVFEERRREKKVEGTSLSGRRRYHAGSGRVSF